MVSVSLNIGLYLLGALMTYQIWWDAIEHLPPSERPPMGWKNKACIVGWPLTAIYVLYFHIFLRPKLDAVQVIQFEEFKETVKREIDAALTERYEEDKTDGDLRIH